MARRRGSYRYSLQKLLRAWLAGWLDRRILAKYLPVVAFAWSRKFILCSRAGKQTDRQTASEKWARKIKLPLGLRALRAACLLASSQLGQLTCKLASWRNSQASGSCACGKCCDCTARQSSIGHEEMRAQSRNQICCSARHLPSSRVADGKLAKCC